MADWLDNVVDSTMKAYDWVMTPVRWGESALGAKPVPAQAEWEAYVAKRDQGLSNDQYLAVRDQLADQYRGAGEKAATDSTRAGVTQAAGQVLDAVSMPLKIAAGVAIAAGVVWVALNWRAVRAVSAKVAGAVGKVA